MEAYCVKCRAKRDMKDAKAITMKNGKTATQGVCPKCGTKMLSTVLLARPILHPLQLAVKTPASESTVLCHVGDTWR